MLSKLKVYLSAALGFIALIFYALFQKEKAGRLKDRQVAQEEKEAVENAGVEAAFKGFEKEKELRREHKSADHSKRDFFE
jgi:hypothetical protein